MDEKHDAQIQEGLHRFFLNVFVKRLKSSGFQLLCYKQNFCIKNSSFYSFNQAALEVVRERKEVRKSSKMPHQRGALKKEPCG